MCAPNAGVRNQSTPSCTCDASRSVASGSAVTSFEARRSAKPLHCNASPAFAVVANASNSRDNNVRPTQFKGDAVKSPWRTGALACPRSQVDSGELESSRDGELRNHLPLLRDAARHRRCFRRSAAAQSERDEVEALA